MMKTITTIALSGLMLQMLACSSAPNRKHGGGTAVVLPGAPGSQVSANGEPKTTSTDPGNIAADLRLQEVDFITGLPRLSHRQWENAVRDVFLLSDRPGLSANFTPDSGSTDFGNDGEHLMMSASLWQDYQIAAEDMGTRIGKDTSSFGKLIPAGTPAAAGLARAKAIVTPLLKRAYRRVPTSAEIDSMANLFVKGKSIGAGTSDDAAGFRVITTAILQAPNFLYRQEIGDSLVGDSAVLNGYEIAARLSFAIWESIPDDALFAAAADGSLLKAAGRATQIERMLKDPRALDVLAYFHSQNYGVDNYNNLGGKAAPWPTDINDTFVNESKLFFNEVVNVNGKGLNEILTAPYTFINSKNAAYYGEKSNSAEFSKVSLNSKQRAGFFNQIGFLASLAKDKDSNLILRGARINNKLFCTNLTFPPGTDVGALKVDVEGMTQKNAVTASTAACGGSCHLSKINPAGFAFENFDGYGQWRVKDPNNLDIDPSGSFKFSEGSQIEFKDSVDFLSGLTSKIEVHRCYVAKLVEYAYGRLENMEDLDLINALAHDSMEGLGTRDLFVKVLSDPLIATRMSKTK